MPRSLRIQYEHACYHVMNRGRGQCDIFHGPEWFKLFLQCLEEAHERFAAMIHAYCLMTNHYHLLVQTPRANLDRIMRHVNGVYTQRYNRLVQTDGSLFRGRYRAIVIDKDDYWLQVSRYIHRNPVETKTPLVDRLERYPWSSYRSYIGYDAPPDWLQLDMTQQMVGSKDPLRYQAYVDSGNDAEFVELFLECQSKVPILGADEFKETVLTSAGRITRETPAKEIGINPVTIEDILNCVSEYYGEDREALIRPHQGGCRTVAPRLVAIYLSQTCGGLKVQEIGDFFHFKSYGSVANSLARIRKVIAHDSELRAAVQALSCRLIVKKTI